MLNNIRDKSLNILENIYHTLDSYEESQKRPQVFSMRKAGEHEGEEPNE